MSDQNVFNMDEHRRNMNPRKIVKNALLIVLLIIIIGSIFSTVFVVKEGEYKVIRQFGDVVKIETEPGLKFKIPFIQSTTTLPKYQMLYDVNPEEITTKDKKRMTVDNYAVWSVSDPKDMITNARTIENAEAKMGEFIFSVIRSELGQLEYEEIINEEKSNRGSFNDNVRERVNKLLERDAYGIHVTDVRMKRTDLPDANEQSVFQRMISERESKAQEYLSQGDADSDRIKAETDKEVATILAKADADAQEIRAEGESEAAKIYNKAFSKDPAFYELYRTLESYKTTLNDETVIMLPADSPYARLLQGITE
ncbi:protease modulator HflC [Guptibacillus hwajinpoensis]|uniref:Protein HflC n=1 Tax=Guptibacillus hwajinpoensis TaxID=208199 RepID=A0ABU0JZ38_9BACL|nr:MULTISPECIES: protease modulator HflC [Alkalihalobacillus]MDP4551546.1 protease modulator HflC [Alkalihalobacillus macyae]MDQ0482324.1 membrane protease subunit HflC [Alkalihalobacillus hemicentroti]